MATQLPRRLALVRVRLTADERRRWTAALRPAETLSDMIRGAVEVDLRARGRRATLEEKRRAEVAANPLDALDEILGRLRATEALARRLHPPRDPLSEAGQ
jgi:hypothetical protein